ncbi:MAG: galactokinase [Candidatus Sulfotelmatobacter sp.]
MRGSNPEIDNQAECLGQKFAQLFDAAPRIFQAPGRVNLIGEHTDYNDGFVMPAAIGFCTRVAIAPRHDRKLVVRSENFAEQLEFNLDSLPAKGSGHWSDYVIGVAKTLSNAGSTLAGANLLVEGDVPQGAGLSSSASLEVAVGYALLDLAGDPIDLRKLALLCQKAENEFVGARCGIMDQFISSHGQNGHALLLDCRSLEYRPLPLGDEARLVICDTMVRHSISGGEYNRRRAECEAGVRCLAAHLPDVGALRDVTINDLATCGGDLPETIMRRCRHVISENARVLQAASALERKDLETFGILMRESHTSLREDFAVSCAELDSMVELAGQAPGVYGARMTGGGFGGCTINLVRKDCVAEFKTRIANGYRSSTGRAADIYVCSATNGVKRVA